MSEKAKVGRPESTLDLKEKDAEWYNKIINLYAEGGSDEEAKGIIYTIRGSFSNDLWDRWLEEEEEFSEVINAGRDLRRKCFGRKYHVSISDNHKKNLARRRNKRNHKEEYRKNPMVQSMRSLLGYHLSRSGITKSKKTFEYFGYTPKELKEHIKSKFIYGMSFDNYGEWHVDHIKPVSSFNMLDDKEIKVCWSLNNLRPLWAFDNLSKSNNYVSS